jgi:energy-coupling factor transport system ATP-binding protein
VPQNPADLLYLDSVFAECREADRVADAAPGTTTALLDRLAPGLAGTAHPRDLSEGQRLALVLAIQLAGRPDVVLLDEPTRGLDYAAKRRLRAVLGELTATGVAVVLSSHDVEFVAHTASRVAVLADGEFIADGPALDVLTASPGFAPQIARIFWPLPILTVDAVHGALAVRP